MPTSVKDVLIEAKRLIKTEGWVRGSFHKEGGFCMLGAINQAATGNPAYSHLDNRLRNQAAAALGLTINNQIVSWNDAQTDVERVYAALDKAIESCS